MDGQGTNTIHVPASVQENSTNAVQSLLNVTQPLESCCDTPHVDQPVESCHDTSLVTQPLESHRDTLHVTQPLEPCRDTLHVTPPLESELDTLNSSDSKDALKMTACTTDEEKEERAEGEEDEDEKDENGIPHDRGWAWMILLGVFMNYVLLSGYLKSSGLFFVELLDKFQATATHTSLLFAIRHGVYSVGGCCVMNFGMKWFQARKLVFVGGILMALSAILSSLASELMVMICLQSALLAAGHSMLISPGQVLLGRYFRARRNLALALSECGVSVGNIVIPPLVAYLLGRYGLHGALLLYGGLCLHTLPTALLHRPTSYFTRLRQRCHGMQLARASVTDPPHDVAPPHDVSMVMQPAHSLNEDFDECSDREGTACVYSRLSPKEERDITEQDVKDSSEDNNKLRYAEHIDEMGCDVCPAISHEGHADHGAQDNLSDCPNSASVGLLEKNQNDNKRNKIDRNSGSAKSVVGIQNLQDPESQQVFNGGQQNSSRRFFRTVLGCPHALAVMLNVSNFRNPMFTLFMVYGVFNPFVAIPIDYLPALVEQNGLDESQAALLVSVYGGIDLICRLTCALIANTNKVRMTTLSMITFVILGVMMQFVRFMTTFEHFIILVVVQGLLGGVSYCMFTVLVIEFVGVSSMAECIGWNQLVSGASMSATYTLLGYIRDTTGSYVAVYHVIGGGLMVTALVLCCERPVRRFHTKMQRENSQ